jgi:hypothetical protein
MRVKSLAPAPINSLAKQSKTSTHLKKQETKRKKMDPVKKAALLVQILPAATAPEVVAAVCENISEFSFTEVFAINNAWYYVKKENSFKSGSRRLSPFLFLFYLYIY